MNWEKIYQEKLRTPAEAIRENVRSGDGIYGGGASVAVTCLNALFAAIDCGDLNNITLHVHSPCNPGLDLSNYNFDQSQLNIPSFFMNPPDRAYMAQGVCNFVPLQYGMYEQYIANARPAVSIVLMSPPDEDGYCNIGPFGFTPGALEHSGRIIAQISRHVPRVCGTAHRYHVGQITAFVEADDPMAIVNNPQASAVEEKISEYILDHVPDGACIQLGIGGIANAVGFGLRNKRHLGVHTEVLTESIVDLIEQGIVDNSRKNVFPGTSTVGFVLGSERQYKFIDQNPQLLFGRFGEIVNVGNIASIDNMISINAAISVDLTGQVCAESIGHRQYSGTGGQLDFVRGASMSKGGGSFIAIPSTVETKQGRRSRIVMELAPGSIVTTPRTDVQYIVTEYGCVNLRFSDIPTRVKKLISIAHPDYRDELLYNAKSVGLL